MIIKYINCQSCTSKNQKIDSLEYRVQKIELKHNSKNVKDLIEKVKNKVGNIKFNSADSSGEIRGKKEQYLKGFSGILVEEICYQILSKHNINKNNIEIYPDESNSSKNQVDIRLIKRWKNENKNFDKQINIEVRSSFPFKKIENIICNDFDVLGPYVNHVKNNEEGKDYYLRFLFELEYREENYHRFGENKEKINYNITTINTLINDYFDDEFNLKKNLVIYFVGGATKDMMNDDSISYIGDMKSETFNQEGDAKYRKIKLRNAIDSISILRLMLGVITTESTYKK